MKDGPESMGWQLVLRFRTRGAHREQEDEARPALGQGRIGHLDPQDESPLSWYCPPAFAGPRAFQPRGSGLWAYA